MKILSSNQLKELDKYTMEQEPIASIDLMERAAQALTEAIIRRWDTSHPIVVFAGPGNNGGTCRSTHAFTKELPRRSFPIQY